MKYTLCAFIFFILTCSSTSTRSEQEKPPAVTDLGKFVKLNLSKKYSFAYNLLTDPKRISYEGETKEEFAYGNSCGMGGDSPLGHEEYQLLYKLKRKDVFLNILKGPNPVGRMYALQGLYFMQGSGVKLTKEETELVKAVIESPTKILTCSGCMYQYSTFKDEYEYLQKYYPYKP
ncbi:hypothetical protein [Leptospira haakeii]|uniref:Lipoprotein n=1 Tax=Leptospira haakeii TaxID=2023198 RepID=A0ABX4PL38_9LEPT|nr:hypothetical protein [Leptospira haakeii]PKA16490.1 hypothetical protein CH363_06825 [Leptospira haakeii]PKA20511.1 hypothetical protein CH377_06230 [Leptospira haakeii]